MEMRDGTGSRRGVWERMGGGECNQYTSYSCMKSESESISISISLSLCKVLRLHYSVNTPLIHTKI